MQSKAIYLAIALSLAASAVSAAPWTYRGSLNDDGQPANGSYDLRVTLLNEHQSAAITSQITLYSVMVENGQFAVDVDFGIDLANAPAMRLQTEVRQGSSGFVTLGEPTRFDPKASLAGVCWDTEGNAGTNPLTNFIGTTDAQAFVVRTHNAQSLRIEPSVELAFGGLPVTVNVIAGSSKNEVATSVRGATIAGGGAQSDSQFPQGGGTNHRVYDVYGTISGGYGNRTGIQDASVITNGFSTVSGGRGNVASGENSTIGGGSSNEAQGSGSTVVGGSSNEAFGNHSAVSGGYSNCAGGRSSWAGGEGAQIRPGDGAGTFDCVGTARSGDADGDEGTFLWAGRGARFSSTGPKQFGVRARGVFFGTENVQSVTIPAGHFITTSSGAHLTTGGTWTNASSRTLKTAFEAIDPMAVLSKVASLPLSTWSYKESVEGRHLGPMAEDFKQIFGLGGDGKSISTVDADGIALAAIQGLNQKLESENAALKSALDAVEARLSALESER